MQRLALLLVSGEDAFQGRWAEPVEPTEEQLLATGDILSLTDQWVPGAIN